MRIALGSDHRGAQIAQKIAADVLLREHYAGLAAARRYGEQLVGAHLISGASCSDSFDESERAETNEEIAIYSLERTAPGRVEIRKPDVEREDAEATAKAVDYPDVAAAVAEAVASGQADRGILICGTGIGMCVAANKIRGVRAAVCGNEVAAEFSRRHNNANVLCLSGEFLSVAETEALVRIWLTTPFDGDRHARRVEKISELERETGL
ncbi:MAG: RpiB/LacA/LacB family sugar-phosphate isomerase [Thermoguttaceae bacterium]|nr:RpiB/LacA/LacB family sugar-phosphate isomerase [Thermoguttaceae bacterium]MBQ5789062.1 RpiB/LacA/LacB family sugar-phosphate isomerase [Thermoguttaceae bacterium]